MTEPRRRRLGLRRPPAVHRPTPLPAPVSPDEVLERAPDVSRETSPDALDVELEAAQEAAMPYRRGDVADLVAQASLADAPEPVPSLTFLQVAKLEAATAEWSRRVRLEVPEDATLLYASSSRKPPPPPARPRLEVVRDDDLPPVEEDDDPATEPDAGEEWTTDGTPCPRCGGDAGHERWCTWVAESPAAPPGPLVPPAAPAVAPARRVSDWTSRHDPRSLAYPVRARLERAVPLQDVSLPAGPVLDQGSTPPLSLGEASACVGMACATAANVLALRRLPNGGPGRLYAEEGMARTLYRRAQDLDAVHGNEVGTSVLAGLQAGQELGLWDGYLWALGGTKDIAQVLLQLRVAVVVGLPWDTALEEPDRYGIIRPGGADVGGHALAVVGLKLAVGGRPGPWFELQQSRGTSEGVGGRVYLHHTALGRLLGGVGEAGVPLPAELLQ